MTVKADLQHHCVHVWCRRLLSCFSSRALEIAGLFFSILCCAVSVTAQAELRRVFKESPPVDVRMVVDISGSMKRSDPKNLRRPAMQLAAEMIPEGASAGVWTFGRFVNMLVPLDIVDGQWRQSASQVAKKINSVGLFTNIPEAIEKAAYGWTTPPGDTARSLILLTDGKVDISKNDAENARARQDVLSRLVPMLRRAKAKVHTIAMSEDVDVELLKALSYETDGRFQTVQSREDLVRVFVQAFDASVPTQQVPLDPSNRFSIDEGVKEYTVLVHKTENAAPTALKTPSGTQFNEKTKPDTVRWFVNPRLDVITVRDPEAGEWQLMASVDPDNRVTVISDLSLSVSGLPNNVLQGESLILDVHFEDKNKVITDPDFLKLVDLTFIQNYIDANKTWEGTLSSYTEGEVTVPEDGVYKPKLKKSLLPGQHEFTVLAEGRTFTRKIVRKVTVLDKAVNVFFEPPAAAGESFTVRVVPIAGLVGNDLRVRAKSQAPDKVVKDVQMGPVEQSATAEPSSAAPEWTGKFKPYGGAGLYRVIVQAVGKTPTGRPVNNKLGPFEAKLPAGMLGSEGTAKPTDSAFDIPEPAPIPDSILEPEKPDVDPLPEQQVPEQQAPEQQEAPTESAEKEKAEVEAEPVDQAEEEVLQEPGEEKVQQEPQQQQEMNEELTEPEPVDELPEPDNMTDEVEAEDEQAPAEGEAPQPEAEDNSSSLLKYGLWGGIGFINAVIFGLGFFFYRKVMKKRAEEEALEDAHLAELTQTDESEFADTASDDDPTAGFPDGIPDGMPDMPDMDDDDDDDLDDAFDLSKTGN